MAAASRSRVAAARAALPGDELLARARATPPPPRFMASAAGFDLIAEVKFRSPAAGALRAQDLTVASRVVAYAEAGAAAISVLTEPSRFDGSLADLETATLALAGRRPAMRKDFLVDPYQVAEARHAGAGGVLAILRMIPEADTAALISAAADLGLFVLLEAFDDADLALAGRLVARHGAAAQAAGAPLLVGINSRDLVTLEVVPGRLAELAPLLPAGALRVAESGVADARDAARLAAAGYDAALVGSALMTSTDPGGLVRAMLESARAAVAARRGTAFGRPRAGAVS